MTTYSEAVEQTIVAGEQIHQIVNGTATTEVTVEDGSRVPSIRKALLDNFYFKGPIAWQVGQTENVFNQLRKFTDGSWWYAPSATASNPISMGSTPVGDPLWKIYDFDAIGKLEPRIDEALRRSYAEAGYNVVGTFQAGFTYVNTNDVGIDETTGKGYTGPAGVVVAGTDPTSGGFVDVSNQLGVVKSAAVAYNLDVSKGGLYIPGVVPTSSDNWYVYRNKIVTGSTNALPEAPSFPFYFVRENRTILLDDYIAVFGAESKDDVIDWQYAINAAAANIDAWFGGVIKMLGGRDYAVESDEFDLPEGVGFVGPDGCVYGGGIKSAAVFYIKHTPSTYTFSTSTGNTFKNVGVWYSQQNWGAPLAAALDMGTFIRLGNQFGKGSYGSLENFSASGNSRIIERNPDDNHAFEYWTLERVAVSATPHGPVFDVPLATDLYTFRTLHVNSNINSSYARRYGDDKKYTTAAISKSNVNAIVFKLGRSDGGTFDDVLTYGMPYGVVAGSSNLDAVVTDAASATFLNCTFDVCSRPVTINCPTGAFGMKFTDCGIVASPAAGDSDQVVVTLGASAKEHFIPFKGLKMQFAAGVTSKFAESHASSLNNRMFVSDSQLSACAVTGLSLGLNKLFVDNCLRNLNEVSVNEVKTPASKSVALLGGKNIMFFQTVVVDVAAGANFGSKVITWDKTGMTGTPTVAIVGAGCGAGFANYTSASAIAFSVTDAGCVVRGIAAANATSATTITVTLLVVAYDTTGLQ